MDNRDFKDLGEQIRDSVQSALDSMDFKQLNRTISDTVNTALDEAKNQLEKGKEYHTSYKSGAAGEKPQSKGPGYRAFQTTCTSADETGEEGYRPKDQTFWKTFSNPGTQPAVPGRIAGILYTVFGGIGLGVVGILFLVICFLALLAKPLWGAVLGSSVFLLILGGISGVMLGTGITMRGRLRRARLYLKKAGDKMYCSIGELASSVGKSRKFVIKDIQKLIEKGILPEAHMDEQKTCLMLEEGIYKQYLVTQEALKQRQQEEALLADKKSTEQIQEAENPKEKRPDGLDEMMAEGQKVLHILREANDAILGDVISDKISRLENVIRRIFESVEKHPEQMAEMEKFMEYYLPTTVKLVNAYWDFDSVEIEGENIASAKHEIEGTLDTINQAFERLLDDLYQAAALDAATDASVLQTMLKKDGWGESDFNRRTKE